jgi:hypothetical protein
VSQSWVTLIMMIRYSYTQTFINMAQRTYCHRQIRVWLLIYGVAVGASRAAAPMSAPSGHRPAGRRYQPESGSLSGRGVLLGHAGRDTPAVADRDALVFRPRPDVAAVLPA